MNKKTNYHVHLSKIVSGGLRNIDCYYLVLKDSNGKKWISKNMRNDQDNDDVMAGEGSLEPVMMELWNYDKMALVEKYQVDFKVVPLFETKLFQDNIEITI